jgi:hypothetical protein
VGVDSGPQIADNRSKRGERVLAGDEWDRDPNVLIMRRVFAAIEARQAEFLDRVNIDRMDRGLRSARKMALQLFERVWAGAADAGVRLGEADTADLYVNCLAKVFHTRGIALPEGSLPGSDAVKKLMGGKA